MDYYKYISSLPSDRLNIFLSTLSVTNRTPEYYVNWEKVNRETKKFEIELNTLNYLIGKKNIYRGTYQVPVVVDSDAHFRTAVGAHENASGVFEEIGFPEELVVNRSVKAFKEALSNKRN